MRKSRILIAAFVLVLSLQSLASAATFTMSYGFKIFGNPNARQVALNLADKQAALEKEEQSELDAFVEGLKRRLVSEVYRDIIDDVFDSENPQGGTYYAGNLVINVHHDPDGGTLVIVEDTVTGEVSIIDMSNYGGLGF